MTDPTDPPAPQPDEYPGAPSDQTPASPEASEEKDPRTPEQQLADYEEALKNDDWGHQPC